MIALEEKNLRQGHRRAATGQPAESLRPLSFVPGLSRQKRQRQGERVLHEGRDFQFPAATQPGVHSNEGREGVSVAER